jgi:hypothetical protein
MSLCTTLKPINNTFFSERYAAMHRGSIQNKSPDFINELNQLADQLDRHADQLHQGVGDPDQRTREIAEITRMMTRSTEPATEPLKSFVESSTADLKSIGLTSVVSEFKSQEEFIEAINKAYPLDKTEPDKESLQKVKAYTDGMRKIADKRSTFQDQSKLIDNLIALREAYKALDSRFDSPSTVNTTPDSLRRTVLLFKSATALASHMNHFNHVMSVKEFRSNTSVFGRRRPSYLQGIDNKLRELEPPSTSRFAFWGKKKISADSQGELLWKLRDFIQNVPANISSKDKKIIEGLRLQVEYALCKKTSNAAQPKQERVQALK